MSDPNQPHPHDPPAHHDRKSRGLTRRGFLGGFGAIGVLGAAAVTTSCSEDKDDSATIKRETSTVPFDGEHQAGIATPPQSHNTTVAFSLRDGIDSSAIQRLLRLWTEDSRRLCAGTPVLADLEPELASSPGNLTITCGFGRGLYVAAGLVDQAPDWLRPLPRFTGDQLDDVWGDRDIVLQICGDDRTTVSHALRVLVRGGANYARPSWSQTGFLDVQNGTPRNLFGFKDGTVNPRSEKEFDAQVWNNDGGTCMIVRRVAFDMPKWESVDRGTREVAMGRTIVEGAPLSGGEEFTDVDLNKLGNDGLPLIDAHSHIALATSRNGNTERMLRRAYNYDLPITAGPGGLDDAELINLSDTGLIFTCFQKDPNTSFIPVQNRLAEGDRLNDWITHVGSAVFHVPRGTSGDSYWGEDLLG